MASLLDQLISQYGNSANNPYAAPQAPAAPGASVTLPAASIQSLITQLGSGPNNPYAKQNWDVPAQVAAITAAQTAARQGDPSGTNDPSIIPIDQAEAANAITQQTGQPPLLPPTLPSQAGTPPAAAAQQAPAPQMATQAVQPPNVASVSTDSSFPSPSDYGSDGAPSSQSGSLLGSLAGNAQQAATDPVKAKGLLSYLGDQAQSIGSKLKNMSPAASQGFLASGLAILANNDGTKNLSQLVGAGGIAGLNQYQTINQNSIANQIAATKLALDQRNQDLVNRVAQQRADIDQWKALHPNLAPGQNIVDLSGASGADANGQAPVVASGGVKAEGSVNQIQPDGSTVQYKTDTGGKIIPGTGTVTTNPNIGPLPADRLKVVNDAQTEASKQATNVAHIQALASKLSPTMIDPSTGKEVPNPNYVNIPGGLVAKGQDVWTKLTGDQTSGQILRNQLGQQTYQDYLATWKPGIGGRLTNTDVNLLRQGMPPDTASGPTWYKFLNAYGSLQADMADRAQRQADFTAQQRGDMSPLQKPLTSGGITFPAGSTYAQVTAGQGGTRAQQPAQNGNPQGGNPQAQSVISRAQAAARAGDANAQAALKQRGLTW